jgi:hypothetical protein
MQQQAAKASRAQGPKPQVQRDVRGNIVQRSGGAASTNDILKAYAAKREQPKPLTDAQLRFNSEVEAFHAANAQPTHKPGRQDNKQPAANANARATSNASKLAQEQRAEHLRIARENVKRSNKTVSEIEKNLLITRGQGDMKTTQSLEKLLARARTNAINALNMEQKARDRANSAAGKKLPASKKV